MRISDLSTFDSKPILLSQFNDLLQANNATLLGNKSNVPSGLVILDNKGKIPEDADIQHIFYIDNNDFPTTGLVKNSLYVNYTGEARATNNNAEYVNISLQVITNLENASDETVATSKSIKDYVDAAVAGVSTGTAGILSAYATKTYVNEAISNIPSPDLSLYQPVSGMIDYAKKTDIHNEVVYVDEFPESGVLNTIYVKPNGQAKLWNGTEFISISYEVVNAFTTTTPSSNTIVPSVKAVIDYVNDVTPTLPDNITTQGNTFNTGNQLVQLVNGKIPNDLYDRDIQHIFYVDDFPAVGVANSLYIKKSSKESKIYTGTEYVSVSLEITNDLTDSSSGTIPTSKSVVDYISAYYTTKTYVDSELNKKANIADIKNHIFYVDSLPNASAGIANSIYVLSNTKAAYMFDGTNFNKFSFETVDSFNSVNNDTVATTKAISSFVDNKIANINLPDNILSIENVSTFPAAATNNTLYIDNSNEIKIYTNNSWKDVSLETVNDFTTVSNETVPTTQAVKTYVDSSIVFPPKQSVAATNKNIIFIPQKSIYTYTVSSATTFTFALDELESDTCYTFELWIKMQTVSPLTFPNNIVWLSGTAPIMNETKTYCIVVRKLPSNLVTTGKNILLNLAYKIDL